MKTQLLFLFFWVVFSLPIQAQLGGEVTGDSARMASMAGAGLAGGVDLLEASRNPAMLGFIIPGNGVDFLLESNLRGFSAPVTGISSSGESFSMTDTSALAPFVALGFPAIGPFRFSFAVRPTSGGSASMIRETQLLSEESDPGSGVFDIPRFDEVVTANEFVQIAGEPSLSFSVTPNLSFGVGASFRETTLKMQSAADVPFSDMRGFVPGLPDTTFGDLLSGADSDFFQAEFDGSLSADLMTHLQIGGAWQFSPSGRIGFWYRPFSTSVDLTGTVYVDVSADLGPMVEDLGLPYEQGTTSNFDISIPDVRFPAQLGGAFLYELNSNNRLHGQVVWTQWSQSFNGWTATLNNPDSPEWQLFLGGDNPSTSVDLDMVWDDTLAFSCGWEHDFEWQPKSWRKLRERRSGLPVDYSDLTFRFGFGWSNNPLRGTAMPGLMPFNTLHVGTGLSYSVDSGAEWTLSSVVALPETWTAGSNKVLSDFSNDSYTQYNVAVVVGYRWSW